MSDDSEIITDFDKKVYNLFLSETKKIENKPFRYRKDFTKIDETLFVKIKKLSRLFTRTPHLMCPEYFHAPFKVNGPGYYDLDYFSSGKGISDYSKYNTSLESRHPDSQLEFFKKSFYFIYEFCKSHNLKLKDYAFYKSVATEDFLKHIKDHKVSVYLSFVIPEMYSILINMESDIYKMFFGDMNMLELQMNFERSKLAKDFCVKCKEAISIKLDKHLESQKLT